jgi:hypothetical protein
MGGRWSLFGSTESENKGTGIVPVRRMEVDAQIRELEHLLEQFHMTPAPSDSILSAEPQSMSDLWNAQLAELRRSYFLRRNLLQWTSAPMLAGDVIDQGRLAFVNRDSSTKMLLELHRRTFFDVALGTRRRPRIPLIDDPEGMGKTSFAYNYLAKCQSLLCATHDEFEKSIAAARTIIVTLKEGERIRGMQSRADAAEKIQELDLRICHRFLETLRGLVFQGALLGDVSTLAGLGTTGMRGNSKKILQNFISDTQTPLFLVLDDIGQAFNGSASAATDEARAHLFDLFCIEIVTPWLDVHHLHILLAGRAGFLRLIACAEPVYSDCGLGPYIARINLNMIRRAMIGEMLDKTSRRDSRGCSIPVIDFQKSCIIRDQVVEAIIDFTNGHPGMMFSLLKNKATVPAVIEACEKLDPTIESPTEWTGDLLVYQECIRDLLQIADTGEMTDLRKVALIHHRRSWSYLDVANRALIRWEGSLSAARLFVSKPVRTQLASLFAPFKEWIGILIIKNGAVIDHGATFELACWKRVQELFDGKNAGAIHAWFSRSKLGALEGLCLGRNVAKFPQISDNGTEEFTGLDQSTAHPKTWPAIRDAMIEHVRAADADPARKPHESTCFLPRDKSASSDAVFLADRTGELVTIGIACKCFVGTLGTEAVKRECEIFNRMFAGATAPKKRPRCSSKQQYNILLLCNSGTYAGDWKISPTKTHETIQYKAYRYIDEICFLNLSTAELRASFFDLELGSDSALKLECIISKWKVSHITIERQTGNP